jgi:hypothetical protein
MASKEDGEGHIAVGLEDLPEPYPLDLASLKDQNDYGEAAFELLKETSMLLFYLGHRATGQPLERNEAIRRGLIKRLNLLGKSLLSDICNNSGYQQLQICRQVVEAASNYFYLAEDEDGSRHDAYVLDSLASEKANLALIDEQVEARGGEVLPIEERMRRSMQRMADVAGVELDSVPGRGKSGWPSAVERLAALSPTAYPSYRSGSLTLHSGWTALLLQDIVDVRRAVDAADDCGGDGDRRDVCAIRRCRGRRARASILRRAPRRRDRQGEKPRRGPRGIHADL